MLELLILRVRHDHYKKSAKLPGISKQAGKIVE